MDITERAYDYSVRAAEIVRYLNENGKDFPLSGKLLDCAVDIGLSAKKQDFVAAAGCVERADYIIEMAAKGGYLTERQAAPVREKGNRLILLLKGD
jgi:hypothetical protein